MQVDMRSNGSSYPGRTYRFAKLPEPAVYEFGFGLVNQAIAVLILRPFEDSIDLLMHKMDGRTLCLIMCSRTRHGLTHGQDGHLSPEILVCTPTRVGQSLRPSAVMR